MKEWSNQNYMLQRNVNNKQTSLDCLREKKMIDKAPAILNGFKHMSKIHSIF